MFSGLRVPMREKRRRAHAPSLLSSLPLSVPLLWAHLFPARVGAACVRILALSSSLKLILPPPDVRAFAQLDLYNPACSVASPCSALPTYTDAVANSFTTDYMTGSAVAKAQGE